MDKFASSVVNEINKFRENPMSVEKRIQSFKLGLSRLRAGDPFIKDIERFINELSTLEKYPTLEINQDLCKAAEAQLNLFIADPEGYENYRSGEELAGIVPKHYLSEGPALLVDDGAEEPYEVLNKFLLNKVDPQLFGRKTLTNPQFTQIGVAHAKRDDDNYVICLFAYKKVIARPIVELPPGDLSELKQAFDLFDINKELEISPKDTVEAMKSLGYDKKNPELYRIMTELINPEYETVDFPMFASHIVNSITDKHTDDGIRTIFNLFVDDPDEDTVSILNLKKIIEELKEEPSQREIDRLLEIKGSANAKLTYEEFLDFMRRVYGDEVVENKKKSSTKVETNKKVTTKSEGKGRIIVEETVITTTTSKTEKTPVVKTTKKRNFEERSENKPKYNKRQAARHKEVK